MISPTHSGTVTLSHSALNALKKYDVRSTDRPVNHHRDGELGVAADLMSDAQADAVFHFQGRPGK